MNKKTLCSFLFLAISLFTFSCKKKDSPAPFYVKVKKNGTSLTWTKQVNGAIGPDGFDPTLVDLLVTGVSDNSSERIDIILQKSGTSFSPGIYDTSIATPVSTSISYVTGYLTASPKVYDTDSGGGSKYLVNITSITPTTIEGTFTGNKLVNSFDGIITLDVTEGEFKVQRAK